MLVNNKYLLIVFNLIITINFIFCYSINSDYSDIIKIPIINSIVNILDRDRRSICEKITNQSKLQYFHATCDGLNNEICKKMDFNGVTQFSCNCLLKNKCTLRYSNYNSDTFFNCFGDQEKLCDAFCKNNGHVCAFQKREQPICMECIR